MKFKFSTDFGYWAIPLGCGVAEWSEGEKTLWVGILCFNLDVTWKSR